MPKTLRLILGDQLNRQHSWFERVDPDVTYLLVESRSETDYAPHHIQKVVAFFVGMRQFAAVLRDVGHQVHYIRLDDQNNQPNISKAIELVLVEGSFKRFEWQLPDEYRLEAELQHLASILNGHGLTTGAIDSEHFLTKREAVAEHFKGKKQFLLESFYRKVRKDHDLMLEADGQPVGGKWNYDAQNRNRYDGKVPIPAAHAFPKHVQEIVEMLSREGVKTIGRIDPERFVWPTNREEALAALAYFCEHHLPHFGTYQDAMAEGEPYLFHSRLSFAMNSKILSPTEVVQAAIDAWQARPDDISLAQIEGFVRQIIGWREFMRGIYWAKMPDYARLNFFDHERPLPQWYWTGETAMNCLRHAITNSLDNAYAHHIQRLMVTGNFAMLAGISPDELDRWYLGIYIDAIEWVEITNTRGMSQFADGGIVGTKPYAASANYMHKMSDYCKGCQYNHKEKVGEKACPFNSLYWHFYDRNRDKLEKNPRIGMAYRTWDKRSPEDQAAILKQAEYYLDNLEEL